MSNFHAHPDGVGHLASQIQECSPAKRQRFMLFTASARSSVKVAFKTPVGRDVDDFFGANKRVVQNTGGVVLTWLADLVGRLVDPTKSVDPKTDYHCPWSQSDCRLSPMVFERQT